MNIVIAQDAELRDQADVVGTVHRGRELRIETSDDGRYQVWWKDQWVWIARADVILFDRALEYFTEAIRQKPTAVDYATCGRIRQDQGDLDGALDDLNEAIHLDPTHACFYNDRGGVWQEKGWLNKAIADFDEAIRLDPTNPTHFMKRGSAADEKGDFGMALADYSEVIRLDPQNGEAYLNRAWLRATCSDRRFRDGRKAIEDAKNANHLTPGDKCWIYDTLAAAHAEAGEFDKAIYFQKLALRLAPKAKREGFQDRLELYEARKPHREKPKKNRTMLRLLHHRLQRVLWPRTSG